MYLALVVVLAGVAILTGSVWHFSAVPLLLIALDIVAVISEVAYPGRKFEARYLGYKGKVKRWL